MTYSAKLKDPRWQKLRLKILERDGWECTNCGDGGSTLAIHHKWYHKGRAPWDYEEDELTTLCRKCHEEEEAILREFRMLVSKMECHESRVMLLDIGKALISECDAGGYECSSPCFRGLKKLLVENRASSMFYGEEGPDA